jgi:hypothetical protein
VRRDRAERGIDVDPFARRGKDGLYLRAASGGEERLPEVQRDVGRGEAIGAQRIERDAKLVEVGACTQLESEPLERWASLRGGEAPSTRKRLCRTRELALLDRGGCDDLVGLRAFVAAQDREHTLGVTARGDEASTRTKTTGQ